MTSYYVMKKGIHSVSVIKHDMMRSDAKIQISQNSKEIKTSKQINKRYELALKQDKN